MDDLGRYNRERWQAMVDAGIQYSRPWLDMDAASAREHVDPEGILGEIAGRDVLCLAGGGGQQSAAFALLGARVTVVDFCPGQLEADRQAARHYGLQVTTVEADMRDLSCLGEDAFDLVWHAHALGFVPDARQVFGEVARVLRPAGLYRLSTHNPFCHGLAAEDWDGRGYRLRLPYVDGAEVKYADGDTWDVEDSEGAVRKVLGPREFRHSLSTLVNGLIERGFAIMGLWEDGLGDPNAEPGTWAHMETIAPTGLTVWARLDGR